MFCPECGAEYREGFTECADCLVKLVAELPPERTHETKGFEQVLSTFNVGDIALIKSLLDDARIEYFIRGETFNQVGPLIQPAILLVRKDQIEAARSLLGHMDVSFLGISKSPTRKK